MGRKPGRVIAGLVLVGTLACGCQGSRSGRAYDRGGYPAPNALSHAGGSSTPSGLNSSRTTGALASASGRPATAVPAGEIQQAGGQSAVIASGGDQSYITGSRPTSNGAGVKLPGAEQSIPPSTPRPLADSTPAAPPPPPPSPTSPTSPTPTSPTTTTSQFHEVPGSRPAAPGY